MNKNCKLVHISQDHWQFSSESLFQLCSDCRCGLLFFMFLLSMCACLWKLRSRSPLLIGGGYAYKPLGQEPAYVQTVSKGVITTIIIMCPLMRYFSRSECIAHYEVKNKTQSKQTSESMQMCTHAHTHTHTHARTRRVSMIALKDEYKM